MKTLDISKSIETYYSQKIKEHGVSPQGVDWNSEKSQLLRFEQLSKIIHEDNFSINDVGCGYGKYYEYLSSKYNGFVYKGYDLSNDMVFNARKVYPNTCFKKVLEMKEIKKADYSVASGIFSVKMQYSQSEWLSYILETLEYMNQKSVKGFSFNMLTKYSDKEYMRDDLYYSDPLYIFDYCKSNFSKQVALLHDYGLYEFTILVRKDV